MNITYILLAYGALFILGIIDNSRGPIYPELLALFQVNKTQGSLIFSIASLSGFLISLLSAKWIKFLGILGATRIALIFDTIACLLMGTVGEGVSGYYQFIAAAIILGLGMAIKGITLNVMINLAAPVNKRRQLYAGLHSMYGIASFCAPLIFGLLFQRQLSWKTYFLFLALIPFVIFVFSFKAKEKTQENQNQSTSQLTFSRVKWFALLFSLYVASEIIVSSRLVLYLKEAGGMNQSDASYLLSGFFAFLLIGRVIFAIRNIQIEGRRLLLISLTSSLVVSVSALLFYPPLLILNGLTMSFFFPSGMDWLGTLFHDHAAYAISVVMMSVGAGLVGVHFIFGSLSDFVSIGNSMWILPLMLSLCWYLLQFKLEKPSIF